MTSLWKRWVGWCTTTEMGTTLAAIRICLGLLIFLDMATLISSGVGFSLFSPVRDGGMATNMSRHPFVQALGGPSASLTTGLLWGGLVVSACLTLGLGGRITAFLMLQILVLLQSFSSDICGGYDRLFTNALWLMVFANTTATLSLDSRMRTGKWTSERLVFAWPRYLIAYQLVVMYVATGIGKNSSLWDPPFNALYYALHRMPYVRFKLTWLSDVLPFIQLGTILTWWWEALFFLVGLWMMARNGWLGERLKPLAQKYDLRWPFLGFGVVMHILVWATLVVGPFSWVTMSFYLAMFSPSELSSFWGRVRARVQR